MTSITLFEDIFEVAALNPDGYKFDGVNRLQAGGTTFDCELLLDINCDIYTLREGDNFALVLASTLHLDGSPADHYSYVPQICNNSTANAAEPNLADNYEYVMHGRTFKVEWCNARSLIWDGKEWVCKRGCGCNETTHKKYDNFVMLAFSFGGLLMRLVGNPQNLTSLHTAPDQPVYLLLKKD